MLEGLNKIGIHTDHISLDQLLKWGNIASTGGEAKLLIKNGKVKINGEIETRRGKKVVPGDIVTVDEIEYRVEKI
jgi:ribosome-associated protein